MMAVLDQELRHLLTRPPDRPDPRPTGMLAERDDSPAAVPVRVDITNNDTTVSATSKKRKHASGSAANTAANSPAPEPLQTISQGPVTPTFTPISEGSPYHNLEQIVLNQLGFRYCPAGASPPGSALLARTVESTPQYYRFSWEDRSPSVSITTDGLGVRGTSGFRSVRGNAPVREGKWYMEFTIELGAGERSPGTTTSQGAHVRLGWARRESTLSGPVGLDGYSYGLRDATGEKVTLSRPKPYAPRGLRCGDVVGMYISLPPLRVPDPRDPADPAHIHRERIPIQLRDRTYFEAREYPVSREMQMLLEEAGKSTKDVAPAPAPPVKKKTAGKSSAPGGSKSAPAKPQGRPLPILEGSRIAFFVNGECQGIAFENLYDFRPLKPDKANEAANKAKGSRRRPEAQAHRDNPFDDGTLGYYPIVSLFNEARVRMNPGPEFAFPPPDDIDTILSQDSLGHDLAPLATGAGGDVDMKPPPSRTWRPISDRYAEYVAEQVTLDEIDEQNAKAQLAQQAKEAEAEEKVRLARERKRLQSQAARANKKAKLTAEAERKGSEGVGTTPGVGTPVPELEKAEEGAAIPVSLSGVDDELQALAGLHAPIAESSAAPSPAAASPVPDVEMPAAPAPVQGTVRRDLISLASEGGAASASGASSPREPSPAPMMVPEIRYDYSVEEVE